ncbi:MAG: S8 family serine peptidase [Acidimicrobiales bacterium]
MRPRRVAAVVLWALATASTAPAADSLEAGPEPGPQWNLAQIGAPAAWSRSTGAGVTIGVVDTGVDARHPDLTGKVDALATCLHGTCREGPADDHDGHGTAVAGVAAATAPDARLVVAKALAEEGGTTEDLNNAIRWVVDHGARVVNLSLGDPNFALIARTGTPLRSAIEYAWSRGAVPVIAAGNYDDHVSEGSPNYGALDAFVVGASGPDGHVTGYSTSLGNAKWGVVAPGGTGEGPGRDVLSPVPGGRHEWLAGTSFAAPHVSGALAVLMGQGLTTAAAVDRLLATLDTSIDCGTGCRGRVQLDAAVAPPPAEPAPDPVTERTSNHPGLRPTAVAIAVALVVAAGLAHVERLSAVRARPRPGVGTTDLGRA